MRVYLLPGPVVFDFIIAAVLIPLGGFLLLTPAAPASTARRPRLPRPVIGLIAATAGCVGGIYGIGGGSILAPILIADGQPPSQVAPAALSSTFATSLAGVVTFSILAAHQHGSVAPNWPTGIALGAGGLAGGVYRRPHAHPDARDDHPAPAGPYRHRDRNPLPGRRPDRRSVTNATQHLGP
jgi:uncharacterized membrane protein YfcA